MNEEPPTIDLEDFFSTDLSEEFNLEEYSLVDSALEIAKGQSEMRDFLSLTIGNLFAFFAILFPPIVAKVIDIQSGMSDQVEQDSELQD